MPRLMIVVASTRPGRVGLPVAEWFNDHAERHGGWEIDLADLAEIGLPFMDEPNHPRLRKYEHAHTIAWSERVAAADAFVFVMPEYNHTFTAPLKNALDYLHVEWQHKPVALVSYGGISAGLRAATAIKQALVALRMTVIPDAVTIPFVSRLIDDEGRLQANELMDQSANAILGELDHLQAALAPLRAPAAA
ncbi:NAD(P)H-dependent oxidoreductase [Conexibacter sp. JD483]|uniref:NADPH-dependent FMN reductase n=1 Tax=unclassified Conexibacter TaxID=2627773 RepID=UPI00271A7B52|nr:MULTISPECIES: NAD(P)H-dependent oxidoreductase [unclassified Conexibacter]MDO8187887.1 NAD(P)H-dependent oxidoreductase [Conexibacter sp. CPCC 205706]MDO8198662.1 NAD(P)H-dependent oxidoreductase [Conexibacter sp. CPCC 205762]MDR9369702.1 NAD(P)H-dependent oxidoreductase [Conexibacter sp. JD483]